MAATSPAATTPRARSAPPPAACSKLLDGSHYGVKATAHQKKLLRLWIETGAAYPGTYAALGCGMIGGYAREPADQHRTRLARHPGRRRGHRPALRRLPRPSPAASCRAACPTSAASPSGSPASTTRACSPAATSSSTSPAPRSRCILLAPLAESAGGWGLCRDPEDPRAGDRLRRHRRSRTTRSCWPCAPPARRAWTQIKRFDMPGFQPRTDWVREMKRYGILPADVEPEAASMSTPPSERYWRSLWHQP